MNAQQQDYDLLTNFEKYNDTDLTDAISKGIPSTIFTYITNKFINDDRSIVNEPALIYELGKSCIDLHDYQRGKDLLSKLKKFILNDDFIDSMIREIDQMISNHMAQVKKYENEAEKLPMDQFYYKWNGLQALHYEGHRNNLIDSEQMSFLKYARQDLNRHDVFEQIFYLYAIETGRIEYVYDTLVHVLICQYWNTDDKMSVLWTLLCISTGTGNFGVSTGSSTDQN